MHLYSYTCAHGKGIVTYCEQFRRRLMFMFDTLRDPRKQLEIDETLKKSRQLLLGG